MTTLTAEFERTMKTPRMKLTSRERSLHAVNERHQ